MRSSKSMLPMAFLCFFVWTVISCTKSPEGLPSYKNSDLSIEERINDLMPRMTIGEKVVQLATLYPDAVVRLGIPHIKAGEALHGICLKHVTSFPSPLAMGSTWDPEIIENMGSIVAKEARALGTHHPYLVFLSIRDGEDQKKAMGKTLTLFPGFQNRSWLYQGITGYRG